MKEMNSETHSCTVSFASLAILALAGSDFFMMREMLAIGRYRSCSRISSPPLLSSSCDMLSPFSLAPREALERP